MSAVPSPHAPDPVSVHADADGVRSQGVPPHAPGNRPRSGDSPLVPAGLARTARIALEAAGWGYLALVVLVCADVVGRRLLGSSTAATTEIGGYLLAFGISWGLAGTLVDRSHIRIDVLIQRLPLAPRVAFHVAAMLVLLGVAAFVTYAGVTITSDSLALSATDLSPLRTPLSLPQGLWAFGLLGFAVTALLLLVCIVRAAFAGQATAIDALCSPKSYQEEADETLEALANTPGAAAGRSVPPAADAASRPSGAQS